MTDAMDYGDVVIKLVTRPEGAPLPIVKHAPERVLISGELIRLARTGTILAECRDRADRSTVLRFGTDGEGEGRVAYQIEGLFGEPGSLHPDTWRARRIE